MIMLGFFSPNQGKKNPSMMSTKVQSSLGEGGHG